MGEAGAPRPGKPAGRGRKERRQKNAPLPATSPLHPPLSLSPPSLQGYGVYRFADKYGANVDGYSPIYTPDTWSESGETYKLGTKGLVAWAGLIAVLLAVGANLIISTSQIGS